jgi:beta-N-acetylhexosaminidase
VDALCLGGEPLDDDGLQWLIDSIVAAVDTGDLSRERLEEAAARTAALGTPPARVTGHDAEIGLVAARRAVEVTGELVITGPVLVVDLVVAPSEAVGEVPWGLGPYLADLLEGTEVLATTSATAEDVAKAADGRTVIVVTREAHRHAWARDLVTDMGKIGLDLVHVETGVPGPDLGAVARVNTHGGSRVCLRAAAERIASSRLSTT